MWSDSHLLGGADKHQEKILPCTGAVHIPTAFTFRSIKTIKRKPARLINRGTDDLEINLQAGGMKLQGECCSTTEQEGLITYPVARGRDLKQVEQSYPG